MNITSVMNDLANAIKGISQMRGVAYPVSQVSPPCGIVMWPEDYNFDSTYNRGIDQLSIPIVVVAGGVNDRTSAIRMAAYVSGTGSQSVKQAVEDFEATYWDSCRVTRVEFGTITIAGTEHLGATFFVDVIGQGA